MQSENISTQIYVECNKMYQSKACVQKFWYFVPGIDNQPEQSENDNLALKKQLPVAKHVKSYAVFICILT